MKWFKHFTNASSNNKLTKVRMRYGAEGYAIYWYCLELIAGDLGEASEINFDLKHDAEVIGFNLKIDQIKVEEIMKYMVSINLFGQSNGVVSCIKLAKYLDKKNTRNQYIHAVIDKSKNEECEPESVADKSHNVADKCGHIATNPARLDLDLDKNIKPRVIRKKKPNDLPCPVDRIAELYLENMPENPRFRKINDKRKSLIEKCWKEASTCFVDINGYKTVEEGLKQWETYFKVCSESDFLTGKKPPTNGRDEPFIADIDFLCNKNNLLKVLENKYH